MPVPRTGIAEEEERYEDQPSACHEQCDSRSGGSVARPLDPAAEEAANVVAGLEHEEAAHRGEVDLGPQGILEGENNCSALSDKFRVKVVFCTF